MNTAKNTRNIRNTVLTIGLLVCMVTIGVLIGLSSLSPALSSEETTAQQAAQALQAQQAKDAQEQAQKKAQEQAQAEQTLNAKFSLLQQQVQSYLEKQPGTYGFVLYSQANAAGKQLELTVGYNQLESFKMASTYKVPVILYLYEQVAAGKISLSERLTYKSQFYATGTGSLQYKEPGGSYTIQNLASLSIRQSDNVALNMLINKLGRDNILNFMHSLGGTAVYQGTPWATPNDLSIYMRAVDNFAKANPELGKLFLDDLKNTDFNDRIRAGTPQQVEVAHKIGNLDGVVNDIGIVYAPTGEYILGLMSKNVPNPDQAAEVEAHVASMVYNSIGK